MSDLIERGKALDCFHDWIDKHGDVHGADEMPEYRAIEALPSAQPEIVRCKDCKWWLAYHDDKYDVGYELCGNPKMMGRDSMIDMSADDFCSYGEQGEE